MIDHLVLPVTTLTLARSRLTGLGFTVAADARHPFGTGNCCVFFADRNYLEPITIVDRNTADQAAAEGLVFVKRLRRFMERRGEGLAMVALATTDAAKRQAFFTAAGASGGALFRFSRKAMSPHGVEEDIGVVLAYADEQSCSDASFFACEHLNADRLFQPTCLQHPNGATGLARVSAVAEAPRDFSDLLASSTGIPTQDIEDGCEVAAGGQRIVISTPEAFAARYGIPAPDPRRGLLFAAFEVFVTDVEKALGYAGPTALRQGELIVVPPAPGLGVALAFRDVQHD